MLTKDVISIIFSIIIIPILALAQGWQPQISPRTDRNLFDIWFVSESIGCACGNFGFLIQTTDAGTNWQDRSGVTNSWIDDMCFANSWIGYAVGEAGTIIKTIDAGENWQLINSGTNQNLYGISFPDTNIGWVTGQGGIIRHTTDAGNTWSDQISGLTLFIFDIEFVNPDTGWACGQNGWVYKTSSGGDTWLRSHVSGSDLHGLKCVSGNELWVVGSGGRIYHITEFGNNVQNWQPGSSVLKAVEIKGSKIWVCGQYGIIWHSSNNGDTWVQQASQTTNYLDEIFFWDENQGWIIGMQGTIRYTENGGVSLNECLTDFVDKSINIRPNPAQDRLKISFNCRPTFSKARIIFWAINGKRLKQLDLPVNGSTVELKTTGLPSGIYFVEINLDYHKTLNKLMITN